MYKRVFFLTLFFITAFLTAAQQLPRIQLLTKYNSVGYTKFFDTKSTKETLKNRYGFTLNISCIYDNNISFSGSYGYNISTLAKPIRLGVYQFPQNTSFFINTFESHVGYCFRIGKNILFETYSGLCETSILIANDKDDVIDKYFKTGVPLGFRVSYLLKLAQKSDYKFAIYFSSNASYNRMNLINPNFNDFAFHTEIGIGLVKEEIVFRSRDGSRIKI